MQYVHTFFRILFELLFPESELEAQVRALSPDEFRRRAAPARHDAVLSGVSGSACFWYRDPLVRRALNMLKFGRRTELATPFGEALAEEIIGVLSDELPGALPPLLVPIPLSGARLRERGFNQSAVLAHATLAHIPNTLEFQGDALVRTREHVRQARMPSRAERLRNMEGVFAISNPDLVRGRLVILLDDIITTGATVRDATRALLSAGARAVHVVSVAH